MNPTCISTLDTLTGGDRKWMDDVLTDLFHTCILCRNFCVLGEASLFHHLPTRYPKSAFSYLIFRRN